LNTFRYKYGEAVPGVSGSGGTAEQMDQNYSKQSDNYLNEVFGIDRKGKRYINPQTGKPYAGTEAEKSVLESLVNMVNPGDLQVSNEEGHEGQLVIPMSDLNNSPMAKFLNREARLPGGGFLSNADSSDYQVGQDKAGNQVVYMTVYNNTNGQLFQGIIGGQPTTTTSSENATAITPKGGSVFKPW
jgi:hypothetical protein